MLNKPYLPGSPGKYRQDIAFSPAVLHFSMLLAFERNHIIINNFAKICNADYLSLQ